MAISVTPIKMNNARTNVTTIWLVNVYEYGISPSMFPNRRNTNRVKINGKYGRPSLPTVPLTMSEINSYIISAAPCIRPGTMLRPRMAKVRNKVLTITASIMNKAELENETSYPNSSSCIRDLMVNCSTGECMFFPHYPVLWCYDYTVSSSFYHSDLVCVDQSTLILTLGLLPFSRYLPCQPLHPRKIR